MWTILAVVGLVVLDTVIFDILAHLLMERRDNREEIEKLKNEVQQAWKAKDDAIAAFMDGEMDCPTCGHITNNDACRACLTGGKLTLWDKDRQALLEARAEIERLRDTIHQVIIDINRIGDRGRPCEQHMDTTLKMLLEIEKGWENK